LTVDKNVSFVEVPSSGTAKRARTGQYIGCVCSDAEGFDNSPNDESSNLFVELVLFSIGTLESDLTTNSVSQVDLTIEVVEPSRCVRICSKREGVSDSVLGKVNENNFLLETHLRNRP
jgi:hypothetical protein